MFMYDRSQHNIIKQYPPIKNKLKKKKTRNNHSSKYSVQFSSVAQSCLTLCDPMNGSTAGLPVHHQHPEFTQIHAQRASDAIQPSNPLSSPSPLHLYVKHDKLKQKVNKCRDFKVKITHMCW